VELNGVADGPRQAKKIAREEENQGNVAARCSFGGKPYPKINPEKQKRNTAQAPDSPQAEAQNKPYRE